MAAELAPVAAQLAYVAHRWGGGRPPGCSGGAALGRSHALLQPRAVRLRCLHVSTPAPRHSCVCSVLPPSCRLGRGEEAAASYEQLLGLDLDDASTASVATNNLYAALLRNAGSSSLRRQAGEAVKKLDAFMERSGALVFFPVFLSWWWRCVLEWEGQMLRCREMQRCLRGVCRCRARPPWRAPAPPRRRPRDGGAAAAR